MNNHPLPRLLRRTPAPLRRHGSARRAYTTPPPPRYRSRMTRLESRLPPFLRRFTTPLRDAPVSHTAAFLLLHEITAVVPLLGLAAFFHYSSWLPPYLSEGQWVAQGTRKFGRYLTEKGWIGDEDVEPGSGNRSGRGEGEGEGEGGAGAGAGVRVVAELATAWAVTKALLPLRLAVSVWCTPWFARWTILPVAALAGRMAGRKGLVGAAAEGVLPKGGKGK